MAKIRIDRSFEDRMRESEKRAGAKRTESSAFGAFVLLLVASGVAILSFVLANPDKGLTSSDRDIARVAN